ncbi:hypothetical protein R84981_002794 [Carnimonas sp. R-84981]
MDIKNTWVEYEGYVMRSRAELRIAHLLSTLGIFYVYEHMPVSGFHGYLPDFYLPHLDVFIEVKGKQPTDIEKHKCEALSRHTGMPVVIAYGSPALFQHRDIHDGYTLTEAGWTPMVFHNGKWGTVAVNMICRMVYAIEGRFQGERFVSCFDSSDVARLQSIKPSVLHLHDEVSRKLGKNSRGIYENNEPVTKDRLSNVPSIGRYESLILDFLHDRAAA